MKTKKMENENQIPEILDKFKLEFIDNLAKLDVCRDERTGIPEVVLAGSKKPSWAVKCIIRMATSKGRAIATKVDEKLAKKIKKSIPKGFIFRFYPEACVVIVEKKGYKTCKIDGKIGLITAGTADIGVAEESRVIAEEMGCKVLTSYDVGIAGAHRAIEPLKEMLKKEVDVIIVVAGMDAVLPITVKGLVNLPVIGVPTSVGYGIGAGGIAPLLTMLQSCSPGLAVVNIDNGFGAAALAFLIASRVAKYRQK